MKERSLSLLLAGVLLCLAVTGGLSGCTPFFYRDNAPSQYHNTKWVCQEAALYFLVDRHGENIGEYQRDGETQYFQFIIDAYVFNMLIVEKDSFDPRSAEIGDWHTNGARGKARACGCR